MHPRSLGDFQRQILLASALLSLFGARGVFAVCEADCVADNRIEMSELLTVVNIVLETQPASACAAGGVSGDASVIDLVRYVSEASRGVCEIQCSPCGDGIVDCAEECDAGGTCVGGAASGMACSGEADCGIDEPGRCAGGLAAYSQCVTDDDCGGGSCRRCATFGGRAVDGGTCASNCTLESSLSIELRPGDIDESTLLSGSGSVVHSATLASVPISIQGSMTLVVGKEAVGAVRPVSVRADGLSLPGLPVGSLSCSCLRSVAARTCGGVLRTLDGSLAPDCTPGFTDGDSVCTEAQLPPCTFVHGEGNSGSGELGCQGLSPIDVLVTQDSSGSNDPPICAQPGVVDVCGLPPAAGPIPSEGPPGSMLLLQHLAMGVQPGSCEQFCSEGDPQSVRGTVKAQFLTTGETTALQSNVDGMDGIDNGPHSVQGNPKVCSELLADAAGFKLAGGDTAINVESFGDTVATSCFEAQ